MQKWEYNLLVQSPNTECARCEEALNGLGRDGWELVTFYVNGGERSGFTDAPDRTNFTYSFDHLTDVIERFTEVHRLRPSVIGSTG
jgi:hypothetical protein